MKQIICNIYILYKLYVICKKYGLEKVSILENFGNPFIIQKIHEISRNFKKKFDFKNDGKSLNNQI